jgi:HK97 family phage major capsid protein
MTQDELKNTLEPQLAELKSLVDKSTAKVAEDSKADITDLKAEISAVGERIKAIDEKRQKDFDEVQANYQRLKAQGAGKEAAKMNVGQLVVKALENEHKSAFDQFKAKEKSQMAFEVKDPATMLFTNATTGQVVDNVYDPSISNIISRNVRIRQLLPQGTTQGDKVPYIVEVAGEGSMAPTIEGNIKPLNDLNYELKEAPVRKIAGHMRISEEMLNDLPWLQSEVAQRGTAKLLDAEDTVLLFGANDTAPNFTGLTISALTAANLPANLNSQNTYNWDAMLAAFAALATREFMADTVAINPADYYNLLLSKTVTNGDYLNPITWTGSQAVIAGVPIRVTTAIPAGSLLVGNFAQGAKMAQREGLSIRFYDQDQDNAVRNLVTVVIEERITLVRYYPDMFYYDTFANTLAGIATS